MAHTFGSGRIQPLRLTVAAYPLLAILAFTLPLSHGAAARAPASPGPSAASAEVDPDESSSPPASVPVPGLDPLRVTLEDGRQIVLLVRAGRSDTYDTLATRYLGEGAPGSLLLAANPGRDEAQAGRWYRLPLPLLAAPWKARALRACFPEDGPAESGWVHRPGRSPLRTYGEGVWEVALWYTGKGGNFEPIMRANGLVDPQLGPEEEVIVPAHLLEEPFRDLWEAALAPDPRAVNSGPAGRSRGEAEGHDPELDVGGELIFSKDQAGPYASYRLKPGEALYSSVVVRFTGRVHSDDVSEAASQIAKRSGIGDVTAIPVGFAVKIPRSMLLEEFLPRDDPRRTVVEQETRAAGRVRNTVESRNLTGIHVILDAGHGGVDPGAMIRGVAEHEVAYDVLCRIKRLLESSTGATVHPIIEDPSLGFTPRSARLLEVSGGERILTHPAHVNGHPDETSLGVHLRWYLANSIARRLTRAGSDPGRIVFASLHADVLHPSLRGAMVYVPGERHRRGSYSCRQAGCAQFAEVREDPVVRFARRDRIASEGLSRQFATRLINAFRSRQVRVHPYQPVRNRIIRHGREWLPAVLRGNQIPVKVLVELVNLNNPADRALVQDPAFRETLAQAFVESLVAYYGGPAPARAARSGKRQ